jgi:hypothetical protein
MGTDQQTRGAQAAEQAIRFLHETAFDAKPERPSGPGAAVTVL